MNNKEIAEKITEALWVSNGLSRDLTVLTITDILSVELPRWIPASEPPFPRATDSKTMRSEDFEVTYTHDSERTVGRARYENYDQGKWTLIIPGECYIGTVAVIAYRPLPEPYDPELPSPAS